MAGHQHRQVESMDVEDNKPSSDRIFTATKRPSDIPDNQYGKRTKSDDRNTESTYEPVQAPRDDRGCNNYNEIRHDHGRGNNSDGRYHRRNRTATFYNSYERQHQSGYNQRGCSNDGQSRNYQAGYVDHDQTYQAEYADHQGTVDYTPAESSFHPKQDREPNEQSRPQQQPSTHSSPPSAKTTGNSSQGVFRGQSHSGAGQHSRGNPGQHLRGNAGQYSRGNRHRGYGGRTSAGKESARDMQLSKTMAFLLRHGAVKAGLDIQSDGYIYVWDLLHHKDLRGYSEEDVERVVKENNKKRFQLTVEGPTGWKKVRASQGHTIEVEDLELEPIVRTSNEPLRPVVHGTYLESLTQILQTGLSRMGRNHIHFTTAEPEERRAMSGMRSSCEVVIYVDIDAAIKDGFKFFRSANGVILSPGNEQGILPKKYFRSVLQRNSREEIPFN